MREAEAPERSRPVSTGNGNHSGLTILELILATAVVGIVMLGVVSSDYAIRRQNDTLMQSSQAAIFAQSMLTPIMNSAFQAKGSNALDRGVAIGAASGMGIADNTFCLRVQHVPADPADKWDCYSNVAGGSLYQCKGVAVPANCGAGNTKLGDLFNDANSETNISGAPPAGKNRSLTVSFIVDNTPGAQQIAFTASVVVRDNSVPVTNKKTVVGTVNPPQYTF